MRAAVCLLLVACVVEPSADSPYRPPAIYREWWAAVESCTGRTGDFDGLRFFDLNLADQRDGGDRTLGRTIGQRLFIAPDYRLNRTVVEHEMAHALTGRGHPEVPWTIPCHLWPLRWQDLPANVTDDALDAP